MIPLSPGCYADENGGLHIVLSELLEANGYADNPHNRNTLIEAWRDIAAEKGIRLIIADQGDYPRIPNDAKTEDPDS